MKLGHAKYHAYCIECINLVVDCSLLVARYSLIVVFRLIVVVIRHFSPYYGRCVGTRIDQVPEYRILDVVDPDLRS